MNAERKLMKAIGTLARVDPFLLSLLLGVERKPADIATMSIDGVTLKYSRSFVNELEDDEVAVVLAHEAMHLAHKHHMRRGNREQSLWNDACDYAINGLLAGRKAAQRLFKTGGLLATNDGMPEGLSAEWNYNKLKKDEEHKKNESDKGGTGDAGTGERSADGAESDDEESEDGDSDTGNDGELNVAETGDSGSEDDGDGCDDAAEEFDGANGNAESSSNPFGAVADCPLPTTEAEVRYTEVMANAEQAGVAAGKMPGWCQELVNGALSTPAMPWRMILRNFICKQAKERTSYQRPSRHYPWMKNPILPSRFNRTLGNVALCIDTSGSMPSDALTAILSEVRGLLHEFPDSLVTVIQFDTQVHTVEKFGQGKLLNVSNWKWHGRGGTDCHMALKRADDLKADVTIVATDGGMCYPDKSEVHTPVLWCMTTDVKPPFGLIARMKPDGKGIW